MNNFESYKKCREKVEAAGYNFERILMLARVLNSIKRDIKRKKRMK